MTLLARNPAAFIRPSPSQTHLGGVARRTRETVKICEAAGFDVILIETVGVGQSETIVSEICDYAEHGVSVVFVELENTKIELMHPYGENSPISKFLENNKNSQKQIQKRTQVCKNRILLSKLASSLYSLFSL